MMTIRQNPNDKSLSYIEGIIKLPVSIIHNDKKPEKLLRKHQSGNSDEIGLPPEYCRLRRICIGPAKFTQTNHTVWSSHQPSGKYLAFNVEWPETPKGANYFDGYSILVLITDVMRTGSLVLVSTEAGFRLLFREQGGLFSDAVDNSRISRSTFIPIGVVYQTSGWLMSDQMSEQQTGEDR